MYRVRVWDLPLRLFHWALVLCVVGMVMTAKLGLMEWHFRGGYAVLALLLFRLAWGFRGGYWGRFHQFVPGPSSLAAYLRGQAPRTAEVGHTPLGALSVLAMLAVLGLQVASGLCADDDIASAGPLARHLSDAAVQWATAYHTKVGQPLVLGLIALHVVAIVFYRWRGNNLLAAMWSGDKVLDFPAPSSQDGLRERFHAAFWLLGCTGVVALFLYFFA